MAEQQRHIELKLIFRSSVHECLNRGSDVLLFSEPRCIEPPSAPPYAFAGRTNDIDIEQASDGSSHRILYRELVDLLP